jgi:NAD(P)-dependent dehydrogenase (short-subunit alcohol dehydrogenase family)
VTRFADQVVLVTGASRGLGAAAAEMFAAEGARVVLLARDVKKLEEVDDRIRAAGGSATLLPFDLAQTEKIAALGPAVAEKFGRLDVLVGNAAILGALSPVAHSDPKTWQNVMKVNFHANVALVRALDPLLRAGGAGRAVFVTSGYARSPAPFWGPYAASKAALEAMAAAWSAEAEYSGLKVSVFDSGAMRTELRAEAFPGENPADLPSPEEAAARLVDLAAASRRREAA